MALGVGVRDGLWCIPISDGLVRSWADRGEGGSEVVEGPCERRVRMADGDGDKFHPPPVLFAEGCDEGRVLSIFSACFLPHPRSRDNPISMRMRMRDFLSKLVWSGSGVLGTPLAYMRSGDVPCPPPRRELVFLPLVVPMGVFDQVPLCTRRRSLRREGPEEYILGPMRHRCDL